MKNRYEKDKVYELTINGKRDLYLVLAIGTKGMLITSDNGRTMKAVLFEEIEEDISEVAVRD